MLQRLLQSIVRHSIHGELLLRVSVNLFFDFQLLETELPDLRVCIILTRKRLQHDQLVAFLVIISVELLPQKFLRLSWLSSFFRMFCDDFVQAVERIELQPFEVLTFLRLVVWLT